MKQLRKELINFLLRMVLLHGRKFRELAGENAARDDAFNDLERRLELLEKIILE